MRASTILKQRLAQPGIIVAPGCFDGLSARLVQEAGFDTAYASGGAIARSTGIPDLGLLAYSEICDRLAQIVDVVDIPVIADMDTGYGNALNARHAVRAFERSGVAGFHLEDQTFPKRCGHLDDKGVVPSHEFEQKLRAVRDALHDSDMVIIARTDALAVEGFDAAIARAEAYAEAGADVVFVEAPQTEEQIREVARRLPQPKLINMFHGGKTPLMSVPDLEAMGYKIVIVPSDTQRAAIAAMRRALEAIRRDGHSGALTGEMVSFKDREVIVDTSRYLEAGDRFGS
ncbi:MAG: isocitrate lyase/PEP mutase family protein [Ectothiorhodospiraceae bacterium]|nr:isocitrate lyase/PEP mutase family protein [Chromatiales bacterium]MCP5154151.1 isocitrate lyase/PEP mutase family protein [Ectothiorhodospiraceae bacterium]